MKLNLENGLPENHMHAVEGHQNPGKFFRKENYQDFAKLGH